MYMKNIKFKQLRYDGFGMSSQTGINQQTIRRLNIYIAESRDQVLYFYNII